MNNNVLRPNGHKFNFWKSIGAKSLILGLFVLLFAFFLYAPLLYNYFFVSGQVLNLYAPRGVISTQILEEFEEKTGIGCHLSYYDTNEELFAKFKISKGEGYDIVFPADYMIELLIREKMLHHLDKSKIGHLQELDGRLQNRYYDLENMYSLPYVWIPYGIGYNKRLIHLDEQTGWEIVFEKDALQRVVDGKIAMLNDAREALFLTSLYLYNSVQNLDFEKIEQVKNVLINQKEFVESYTEEGAKYLLLSNIVPLAIMPASRIKEVMAEQDGYGFIIPRQGSIIDITNIAIPVTSQKIELAHKLIDFLLSKDVGAFHFTMLNCNPANKKAYELVEEKYLQNKSFFPDDIMFSRLHLIHNQIPPATLERLWFSVKSA